MLENVSLTVERGDFLAVLGPNGGGQVPPCSRSCSACSKPDSGTVAQCSAGSLARRGGRIGYLPQYTYVFPARFPITVLDAVPHGHGPPGVVRRGRAAQRQNGRSSTRPRRWSASTCWTRRTGGLSGLSGGQKQRVFIARALVDDPGAACSWTNPTASVDLGQPERACFRLLTELNEDVDHRHWSATTSRPLVSRGQVRGLRPTANLHFHKAPEITGDMFPHELRRGATTRPAARWS